MPHRSRLRVPAYRGDRASLQRVADHLERVPGVSSVEINPQTGSLLVHHQGTVSALLAYGRDNALFVSSAEASAARTLSASINSAISAVDHFLRETTGGQLNLPTLLATIFVGMATSQIVRGRFSGSTLHLLLLALHAAAMGAARPAAERRLAEEALGELDVGG
jgi:hypothetical protein